MVRHLIGPMTIGVAAALLAGCAGMELDRAKRASPGGTAFQNGLYEGYVTVAAWEQDEADYADADAFASRALMAAGGRNVDPEAISRRALPEDKVAELSDARRRLVDALAAGARDKAPGDAAHAQVMFDCWMQEQEENFQPEDIAYCRSGFMAAMAKAEAAVKPRETAMPAPQPAAEPAPQAAMAPAQPAPRRARFVVFFPFDSAKLTPESDRVVLQAIDAAKKMGAKRVSVFGHTDSAGAEKYNSILSQRRAGTVADLMVQGGLPATLLSIGSFGENILAVSTGDNVPLRENRRVEIEITN